MSKTSDPAPEAAVTTAAHPAPEAAPAPEAVEKQVTGVAFVADLGLELEPCGCQVNPLGGLRRQQHFLSQWRGRKPDAVTVALAGGVSFVPTAGTFQST